MSSPARSVPEHDCSHFHMPQLKQALCTLLLIGLLSGIAPAQKPARPASEDDLALIERASERELKELESPKLYRYQEQLDWNWGSETRSVIETAEGRADRIVLFDGEPLSPDQQVKQQRRLEKLLSDHDALKNELKDQKAKLSVA